MQWSTFLRRSLAYHRGSAIAVALGVAVGTAVLTGALLVGDSMRGSLRDRALSRLNSVESALVSERFFEADLDERLAEQSGSQSGQFAASMLLRGAISHADTRARVNRIQILGAGDDFPKADPDVPEAPGPRDVQLNETLAQQLGAAVGDDVLLRVGRADPISSDTLLGRRDDRTASLRLTVAAVIPDGKGDFSLRPGQGTPRNAFVALETIAELIEQPRRANVVTVSRGPDTRAVGDLEATLAETVTLDDYGVTLRADGDRGYLGLETRAMLLPDALQDAGRAAAEALDASAEGLLSYLANDIARGDASVPYSAVVALDPAGDTFSRLTFERGEASLEPGDIVLNAWTADDLGASIGDAITLRYYVTGPFGTLEETSTTFRLAGVVAMDATAADAGFVPEYEGVTDVERLSAWDPPFSIDLRRIRDRDEAYWEQYRTAPKAFIALQQGQQLWSEDAERQRDLTALRLRPPAGQRLDDFRDAFAAELLDRLDPGEMGLQFVPVRQQALTAATGTTDFGQLFIGFSFFLIAAAAMLVALLFRLGVERRSSEIGTLLAVGIPRARVSRMLLAEGAVLAAGGTLLGLTGALLYAAAMLAGLRSWWADAANAPFLTLHASPASLAIGLVASFAIAIVTILLAIRGLTRRSARALMAGAVEESPGVVKPARVAVVVAVVSAVAGIALAVLAGTGQIAAAGGFFGSGALLLAAGLATTRSLLRGGPRTSLRAGSAALLRLGGRNAGRHPGRSMLIAGLVASATFLVGSIGAFRLEGGDSTATDSGTGGFPLLGEAATPLVYDPGTSAGQEKLNVSEEGRAALAGTKILSARLRPGDAASCLNLYRPTAPRVVGVPDAWVERGGFRFSGVASDDPAARDNPWTLLREPLPDDGVIPAIGDEAAVLWQLHSGLGQEIEITDERGRTVRLRFVALLSGSVLQDELLVSERHFGELFPSIDGYGFFLIDPPAGAVESVQRVLEEELYPFGLDVTRSAARLADYLAVQNTYLTTFQTLGGFGLVLGSIGLAVVLLRNVWERRSELALLRAVGFRRAAIGWLVLAENAVVVVAGLAVGVLAALVATLPAALDRTGSLPLGTLTLTLLGVLIVGLGSGLAALAPVLRSNLVRDLRSE